MKRDVLPEKLPWRLFRNIAGRSCCFSPGWEDIAVSHDRMCCARKFYAHLPGRPLSWPVFALIITDASHLCESQTRYVLVVTHPLIFFTVTLILIVFKRLRQELRFTSINYENVLHNKNRRNGKITTQSHKNIPITTMFGNKIHARTLTHNFFKLSLH